MTHSKTKRVYNIIKKEPNIIRKRILKKLPTNTTYYELDQILTFLTFMKTIKTKKNNNGLKTYQTTNNIDTEELINKIKNLDHELQFGMSSKALIKLMEIK